MHTVFTGKAYKEDFINVELYQRYLKNPNYEFIYVIECKGNGKKYVGKAKDIKRRYYQQHLPKLRAGNHTNSYMQRAFNKYGEDMFVFNIIDIAPSEDIYRLEVEWVSVLDTFNNGFNSTAGGEGAVGVRWEDEKRNAYAFTKTQLTKEDIIAIYLNTRDSRQVLAHEYNVHIDTIYDIQNNRTFNFITEELCEVCREYTIVSNAELEQAYLYNSYGGNYVKVNGERILVTY